MADVMILSSDNPTIYAWTKQFVEGLKITTGITGKGAVAVSVTLSGLKKFVECFNPDYANEQWDMIMQSSDERRLEILEDYLCAGEFKFPIKKTYTDMELKKIYYDLHAMYPVTFP